MLEKLVRVIASKLKGQLESTSDHFQYLSYRSVRMERDMHDWRCRESSESGEEEEVLSLELDLAECLLDFCSSSSTCNVEKQILVLYA